MVGTSVPQRPLSLGVVPSPHWEVVETLRGGPRGGDLNRAWGPQPLPLSLLPGFQEVGGRSTTHTCAPWPQTQGHAASHCEPT